MFVGVSRPIDSLEVIYILIRANYWGFFVGFWFHVYWWGKTLGIPRYVGYALRSTSHLMDSLEGNDPKQW